MIPIYDLQEISMEEILDRTAAESADVSGVVGEVLRTVRARGDEALLEYEKRFDQVELDRLLVTPEELEEARKATDPYFLETLELAAEHIRAYHSRQVRSSYVMTEEPGVVLGQKVIPLDRVGIYVPGGTASYPSSVLMNAIPAQLAGVGEIVMATPPDRQGRVAAPILAAAAAAGVTTIVKAGGAQAVAALAYGTESVPRVDKIVGPGNLYVATAKRMVYGQVDIDMIAGPSEILVLADGTCNPRHVAADLLSQAEHDRLASAVLLTDSWELAQAVDREVVRQTGYLERSEIMEESLRDFGCAIVCDSLERCVELANEIAPEHLEIMTEEPRALLPLVKNAGAVFLGAYTPEPLGDYLAGPDHVLPTSGTARFFSPLSVDSFLKTMSVLEFDRAALAPIAGEIITLAETEHLTAHANSIRVRMDG